jgi:hypothetical protein
MLQPSFDTIHNVVQSQNVVSVARSGSPCRQSNTICNPKYRVLRRFSETASLWAWLNRPKGLVSLTLSQYSNEPRRYIPPCVGLWSGRGIEMVLRTVHFPIVFTSTQWLCLIQGLQHLLSAMHFNMALHQTHLLVPVTISGHMYVNFLTLRMFTSHTLWSSLDLRRGSFLWL